MQLFFILTVMLIGVIPQYLQNNETQCLEARQTFPLFTPTGILTGYDTSTVRLYTYRNMVMYQLNYLFDSVINNKPSFSEKRTHHFIYYLGEEYGIDYDMRWYQGFRRTAVVDIFRTEWIKNNNLYNAFVYWNTKPENLYTDTVTGIQWLSFSFYDKINSRIRYAKCSLGFSSSIRNTHISLSRELDSIFGIKLIHAKFYYDKFKTKSQGHFRDSYTSSFSLKEVTTDLPDSILQYFQRFVSERKSGWP